MYAYAVQGASRTHLQEAKAQAALCPAVCVLLHCPQQACVFCAVAVHGACCCKVISENSSESSITHTLARVTATLSRAASDSSVPMDPLALERTKDSRMTGLSRPWHLSMVSTSTWPLDAATAAAAAGVLGLLPLPTLLLRWDAASTSFCRWLTCSRQQNALKRCRPHHRATRGRSNCSSAAMHAPPPLHHAKGLLQDSALGLLHDSALVLQLVLPAPMRTWAL